MSERNTIPDWRFYPALAPIFSLNMMPRQATRPLPGRHCAVGHRNLLISQIPHDGELGSFCQIGQSKLGSFCQTAVAWVRSAKAAVLSEIVYYI